jgi:hypothetical protein
LPVSLRCPHAKNAVTLTSVASASQQRVNAAWKLKLTRHKKYDLALASNCWKSNMWHKVNKIESQGSPTNPSLTGDQLSGCGMLTLQLSQIRVQPNELLLSMMHGKHCMPSTRSNDWLSDWWTKCCRKLSWHRPPRACCLKPQVSKYYAKYCMQGQCQTKQCVHVQCTPAAGHGLASLTVLTPDTVTSNKG